MSESDTAEERSAGDRNGSGSDDGPKQVSSPNYHHENHTAAQTCGWTANALRGEVSHRYESTPLLNIVSMAEKPPEKR